MPTPNPNENRGDFVSRCYADPKSKEDFPNGPQRLAFCYSQFEKYKEKKSLNYTKKQYDNIWLSYNKERLITEKKEIKNVYKVWKKELAKLIPELIESGSVTPGVYFKEEIIQEIYKKLYVNTGLHFAKWYANNFTKFQKKAASDFIREWESTFVWYSQEMSKRFGAEIANATTQAAIRKFEQLMKDPVYANYGRDRKGRILAGQMNSQALYIAKRIVTTESTRISNYAIHQSSLKFFNPGDLLKVWISALDTQERDSHRDAHFRYKDGIPVDQMYEVGGESMAMPGAGTIPENNINCRCLSIDIPKPGAESIADIDSLGLGVAGASAF